MKKHKQTKSIRNLFFDAVARYYLKKPEQAEFLETRYNSFSLVAKEVINQICYIIKLKKSFTITSIQLELTNHCNLKCSMCPVSSSMKRKRGFMDSALFKKIVDENPDVEFYLLMNWGESLLHPRIFDTVRYIKEKKKRPLLTTNGVLLTPNVMEEMVNSGLERVTISLDGFGETFTKVRGYDYNKIEKKIFDLIEIRDKKKSTMAIDINMVIFEETEKQVDEFIKKWRGIVDRVQIQPKIEFQGKRKTRCKEPWRGNVIVLWDGTVVPCCIDYEGEMNLGDANEKPLNEIFNSKASIELRMLHNKYKFTGPCSSCSEYITPYVNPRFE